jgi:hypothetical protein
MADELDRILDDLRDELRGLSRVLQSTFKIFDKGNNTEKQHQQNMLRQRRQLLDVLKKEGVIKEDQYKQGIKVIEQQSKNTTALKKATAATKDFGKAMADTGTNLLKELAKGVVETGKNFGLADRKIEGFADATKGFDGLEVGVGNLKVKLSDFGQAADFNVGIFKQLSQTGAGFGKSVIQLRNAATSANMPILDFVDLIQTNSSTFARLFGTVMDGMPTIQGFTRELRTRTQNELAEFGLNLDDTSEFLVTQLEIQRARGNAERVSQMDLVSRTVEYAKNLTKLSKLTGIQVSELDATNRQLAVEGAFQASLLQLNQKGRDATARATAAMENLSPELATVIKDVTQFGTVTLPVSRAFEVGAPQIIEFIKQLNQGTMSSAEFVSKVKGASNTLGTDFAKSLADASKFGAEGFEEFLNSQAKLAGSSVDTADKQMKALGDNTAVLVGFKETIDTLKVQAEEFSTKVFGKVLNSQALKDALDLISGGVEELTTGESALDRTIGFFKNIGTAQGTGRGTLLSTADDSMFGMARRAGERIGAGGEGNSIIDIITPWDTLAEKIAKQETITGMGSFNKGSGGFQDFGAGTPAILHGSEAVVPENSAFGSAVAMLEKIAKDPTGTTQTAQAQTTVTAPNNIDRYLEQLVDLNKRTEKALNTLVTIGAMTEKNTKGTKQTLANMGGSLV